MRVLISSDIHTHKWTRFGISKETGNSRMYDAQVSVVKQIHDIYLQQHVDCHIFGGDAVVPRGTVPTVASVLAKTYFGGLIPTFACTGNHDLEDDSVHKAEQNILTMLPVSIVDGGFAVWMRSGVVCTGNGSVTGGCGFNVFFVEYPSKLTQAEIDSIKGYDLVILHKMPIGSTMGGIVAEDGVRWEALSKNNKLVMFGHNHTRQQLAENVFVIGSPMDMTFGDSGAKGVWILDTDAFDNSGATEEFHINGLYLRFYELQYPKFITVKTKDQIKDDGNFYRVTDGDTEGCPETVIGAKEVFVCDERIKGTSIEEILKEWSDLNGGTSSDIIMPIVREVFSAGSVFKPTPAVLKSVSVRDFGPVRTADLEFKNGVTVITGDAGEYGSSNGSGKTTLIESVYWCLFGETSKGLLKEDVIRHGCDEAVVSVVLRYKDLCWEISRSTEKGLFIKYIIAGEEHDLTGRKKAAERERVLREEVLGFDSDLYRTACYFSQVNVQMFTEMGDTERIKFISGLLSLDKYDEMYTRCTKEVEDRAKVLLDNESVLISSQAGVSSWKETAAEYEKDIKTYTDAISVAKSNVAESDKQLNDLSVLIEKKNKEVEQIKDELTKEEERRLSVLESFSRPAAFVGLPEEKYLILRNKKAGINERLLESSRAVLAQDSLIKNIDDRDSRLAIKQGNLRGAADGVRRQIDGHAGKIAMYRSGATGQMCSVCGNTITADSIQNCIAEVERSIASLEGECSGYAGSIEELEGARNLLRAERTEARSVLTSMGEDRKKIEEELVAVGAQEDALRAEEKRMRSVYDEEVNALNLAASAERTRIRTGMRELRDQRLSGVEADCQVYTEEDSRLRAVLAAEKKTIKDMTALLKEKTLRLSGVMDSIGRLKNDIVDLECICDRRRDEIKVFEFWKNAFSNKGIKTVLLDRFCNGMNSILAGLVAEISGGSLSVWLSPTSLTASGELRNRLSINMKVKGISRSFESLSGGGQKRVALCLCLALHRWVGVQYDTGDLLGVMFFDEVFSFMDECGEEATALRLQEEAKTKFIGIVTHTPDLSSYADNVVVVKGGIDGSVIEGGV